MFSVTDGPPVVVPPPEPLVALIERYCKGNNCAGNTHDGNAPTSAALVGDPPSLHLGPCYGVLAGLHALASELGLVAALGPGRQAKLALFMIYARVAWQGSRLGAVRWAEDHTAAEVLGLDAFDEDDL